MGNVTTLKPRTHAIRRALETYAKLHPSNASPEKVQADLQGFIVDMLVDLYHLADDEGFALNGLSIKAARQAKKEGASV